MHRSRLRRRCPPNVFFSCFVLFLDVPVYFHLSFGRELSNRAGAIIECIPTKIDAEFGKFRWWNDWWV